MKKGTCHHDKLTSLRRIEGQVRAIQKMIDERRYCVEILQVVGAAIGALKRVEGEILESHLEGCAKTAFHGKKAQEKDEKLKEIVDLLKSFRK